MMIRNSVHSRPSAHSGATLTSFKSKAEVLPSTRVCPYAASWFTIPNALIKMLMFVFSAVLLGLLLSWESEGIRIFDLTDNDNRINYRNPIYCYLGVTILTVVYSILMTILGCGGFNIPPITQALVIGAFLLVWLVSSAFISASLDTIGHTRFARDKGLDILFLRIANVFGFLIVISFTLDILLAFVALRAGEEDVTASQGLKESKSIPSMSSSYPPKYTTGRGSYRHRQSSLSKFKEATPVIMKEGTPIAHI